MYCRKEMVKILKCCLIPKKSYGTLSKGAIFLANPVYSTTTSLYQAHTKKKMSIISSDQKTIRIYSVIDFIILQEFQI